MSMRSPLIGVTVSAHSQAFTRHSEGDVIELADGRLYLAYMEFSGDGSDEATTRLAAKISSDGGATWGDHRVLALTDPGDMNVYSPNLIRLADGSILLVFMRQHQGHPRKTTFHAWRSEDEAATFEPWAVFEREGPLSLCNAVIARLPSGRLLLPVTVEPDPAPGPYPVTVLHSDDEGRSWRRGGNQIAVPMRGLMEPHVAPTRDGRVLMAMRTQLGAVFLSESADEGVTWSPPQTTGLKAPESCPALAVIPTTGDLLMIWNDSPYDMRFASHYGKRSPLTAAVSIDEGRTWRHIRHIEDDPARAFSNPGVRFTRDGRAVINYWTCEYLPTWFMQDVIDLRVAVLDASYFYDA